MSTLNVYEKRSKQTYQCYTLQHMNEYQNGKFYIVGEMLLNKKEQSGTRKKIDGEEQYIYVEPVGSYSEKKYKTIGYIKCTDEEFVAVKRKNFPLQPLIVLLLLLLLGIGLGVIYHYYNDTGHRATIGEVDPNAVDYESTLKRPDDMDESQILIPGYGTFNIKAGMDKINTVLLNPKGNPCYFQFSIILKENNECIYKSKLIPPGKAITPVTLSKTFSEAGEYQATLKIETVDFEDASIHYNGAETSVKIVVK